MPQICTIPLKSFFLYKEILPYVDSLAFCTTDNSKALTRFKSFRLLEKIDLSAKLDEFALPLFLPYH